MHIYGDGFYKITPYTPLHKKDRDWIDMTKELANRFSKCCRAKYAIVLLNSLGHIIGAGYNGKPRGCDDTVCHRDLGACCIHAEINGLSWSSPKDREGGTAYVSGAPCDNCALSLLNSGVKRLVYLDQGCCAEGVQHKSNIVDKEFYRRNGNEVEVVAFTYAKWYEHYGGKDRRKRVK